MPTTDPAAPAPPWSRRATLATAGGLTLAALLVRWLARPGRPMWFDECVTVALARYPLRPMLAQLGGPEANGGLHTLLLAGLLRLTDPLGLDALAVGRALSGLVGVATVPAFFFVARRLAGARIALVAGALLVLSRFHVFYSLEARGYALALLLVVLSTLALLRTLERPTTATALAFGALAALATWAHVFAALVLAAQAVAAPFHPGFQRASGRLVAGFALAGLGAAGVVVAVMRGDGGQVGWIGPLGWSQIAGVFVELCGGARLLLLPATAGAVVAARAAWRGGDGRFGAVLALAWLLVPLGLAVGVSAVKPLLVPRYLLVALPGFLLLVALGVGTLRRPRLIVTACLILAGLATREVVRDRRAEPLWQPLDRVAARLLELARPGDALVVSHPALTVSIERELDRRGRGRGPERVEPLDGDPLSLGLPPRPPLEARLSGRPGVLFVLASEQGASALARAAYQATAEVTSDEDLGGIRLLRLERRGPP